MSKNDPKQSTLDDWKYGEGTAGDVKTATGLGILAKDKTKPAGPTEAQNIATNDLRSTSGLLHQGAPTTIQASGNVAPTVASSQSQADMRAIFDQSDLRGNDTSKWMTGQGGLVDANGGSPYTQLLSQYNEKTNAALNSSDPAVRAAATKYLSEQEIDRGKYTSGPSGQRDYEAAIERQKRAQQAVANNEIPGLEQTPQGPSMLDEVNAYANRDRSALGADRNAALQTYGHTAGNFANGSAGAALGGTDAAQAGLNIGKVGQDSRALGMDAARQQFAQANQTSQDLGMVRDSAQGNGPSAAAILGQKMLSDNARSMSAQAATARGGNLAGAQRSAILGGSNANLQGTQQIMAQRAQEQLNAQTLLGQGNASVGNQLGMAGQTAGGIRTSDVGQAADTAKALNSTYAVNSGNAQAGLGAQGAVAQQTFAQTAAQMSAEDQARLDSAKYLQQQYGIESGIPVAYNGQNLNYNAQASAQNANKDSAQAAGIASLIAAI